MYFSLTPDIVYDQKPVSYPFSVSDKIIAKNFFRRYQLNDDIFSVAVYFSKYAIIDTETPAMVADKAYGSPFYDWVILLVNNMVNAQYDWPLNNYEIYKVLENEYDDPYGTIHHYETYEIAQYPSGLHVDETFYNGIHKLNIDGTYQIKNGNEICRPVTIAEWFSVENEKKREIYLLKPEYFRSFVDDYRKKSIYKKSNNFISRVV